MRQLFKFVLAGIVAVAAVDAAKATDPIHLKLFDIDKTACWADQNMGCNLSGLNRSGFDASKAVLPSANFTSAQLSNEGDRKPANFTSAHLEGSNFTAATLTGAIFKNAHLNAAILRSADFSDADMSGAILTGADVLGAIFDRTRFCGTDLRGVLYLRTEQLTKAKCDAIPQLPVGVHCGDQKC